MKRIPISVLISIVAVLLIAGGALAASLNFRAHMQANEIIPLPSTLDGSTAQGQAIFQIADDEMSMSYKINVANIDKVTMAHIHKYSSEAGRNGPILVWLFPGTGSTAPGSPTERMDGGLVEGVIYLGSGDRKLYAIDARTGQTNWTFATGAKVRSTPAVVNGRVYFGGLDRHFYALDAATGTNVWKYRVCAFW